MAEKQQSRKGKNHLDGLIRRPLPSSTERLLQVIQIFLLKVPKHEIFDGGFFASKEPIWSPDS
jgi:hypothetical protein